MWIVKNETAHPVGLPELGLEIGPKEYQDLDAPGRERAEASAALKSALDRGALRTISKTATEEGGKPPVKAPAPLQPPSKTSLASAALKDLADHPPVPRGRSLLLPEPGPEAPDGEKLLGVKESFLKSFRKKKEEPDPENLPQDVLLIRKELERFRKILLDDINKLLNDYLRP